jgi:hypothetical protein
MAARKPQSVRYGVEEHRFIADEMIRGNVTSSEAQRRLLRRGANAPEPVYLASQVSSAEELDRFAQSLELWRQQWAEIGSLVRAVLPPNADEDTVALVTNAKRQSKQQMTQALDLASTANVLSKKMTGLSHEDFIKIQNGKRYVKDTLAIHIRHTEQGKGRVLAPELESAFKTIDEFLKVLGI